MKRYRYILALILILSFGNTFAHQDFSVVRDFGKVKVRIETGYRYEEFHKVFLFGQLAEQLAKQLNYSGEVFLDFDHDYIKSECTPDYFISYDKGYGCGSYEKLNFLKKKSIVVKQRARQFDAQTTLKLLEYAILNIESIKSSQKIIYNKNYYRWWKISSIDTNLIKKILNEPNSNQLNNTLSLKIERPYNDYVSYYLQNNKYTVFFKGTTQTVTELITLDNVYQFYEDRKSLVFDTDTSFYYIDGFGEKVSKRHIIQNTNDYYKPYRINYIGNEKLSIHFRYHPKKVDPEDAKRYVFEKEQTLIYLMGKDILIQDLDELINKQNE